MIANNLHKTLALYLRCTCDKQDKCQSKLQSPINNFLKSPRAIGDNSSLVTSCASKKTSLALLDRVRCAGNNTPLRHNPPAPGEINTALIRCFHFGAPVEPSKNVSFYGVFTVDRSPSSLYFANGV